MRPAVAGVGGSMSRIMDILNRFPDLHELKVATPEPGLLFDLANRRRLPATEFTRYQHCGATGDRPDELWNFRKCQPNPPWLYLGWCPSDATQKPESGWPGVDHHVAVLLANERNEMVWLHVPMNQAMQAVANHVVNSAVRNAYKQGS